MSLDEHDFQPFLLERKGTVCFFFLASNLEQYIPWLSSIEFTSVMNDPKFLTAKKCYYKKKQKTYIACNSWLFTFGYACQQKYLFNIQWHKKKTFIDTFETSTIKINVIP